MAERRVSRWYFGGLASSGAACCTHPLDLLKVHLQTQQEVKMRMMGMAMHVIRTDGFLALYNGLSASLCRQMTYSLTRFGIYETAKNYLGQGNQGPPPFYQKVLLAAAGGFTGGFVGTPADMVNVRMQNDMKQPPAQRRNYSHALDGMYRVLREEGLKKLFSGASVASCRGALVTVGQLSCYDQAKQLVLATGLLSDNIFTHFLSSFIAGGCATFLCQPLDVLKTRLMNSHGEYRVSHPPCPPCCCLSSCLCVPASGSQPLPLHLSPSHFRVSPTVPWKLPSSDLSPSTRASFLLLSGSFLRPFSPLSSWSSCANILGSK
ncbi:mitochondrial dicarboxylate carrier isoform X1 [Corvus cornix cornix]|uniref:mitochondrial dicarboxylate carrier isoform X1 n=1 Tax=Corvus cornix cornix TaxID=932674 RepID=UPI0019527628|nr:mitochondrial dicarboxylate carrier isoform X1 [Corvus cornix cornix]